MVPPLSDLTAAVELFDSRHGESERVLWFLSQQARPELLAGAGGLIVETLVWTVKSWWGVQGVTTTSKTPIAQAIAELGWSDVVFTESSGGVGETVRVETAVAEACRLGAPRREFSLVSKVLHWLLPWQIPAYDNYVRSELGVPDWEQPMVYRAVAEGLVRMATELSAEDDAWIGGIEPRSPLRALDKYLWWVGGGATGYTASISDPWSVVRGLGLTVAEE